MRPTIESIRGQYYECRRWLNLWHQDHDIRTIGSIGCFTMQRTPQQTSFEFHAALMANTLISGNGYAEIERNSGDGPVALWHLEPHRLSPR
jgi:hypothetical protein